MRCLLDKVTARLAVQGLLKLGEDRELTRGELLALDLFLRASRSPHRLFIVPPTASVLRRCAEQPHYSPIVQLFLARVEIVQPARYFKRWARRLRDLGFAREDAAVLALATFGTDSAATILGMEIVATCDQAMANNWAIRQSEIQARLSAMQRYLSAPYNHARLPQVLRPEQIAVE
ncbi:MAG: hypothetical protein FJ011_09175 [Chloroflexi bacterium]|nr:hypothetical protein [Chloroflexota bacterium]